MVYKFLYLSLFFVAVALLSACASPTVYVPQIETRYVQIPAQLLECREQPSAPAEIDLQSQVARYIVDLAAAGADCRSRLQAIRELSKYYETI